MDKGYRVGGKLIDLQHPVKEYPRPQMVRKSFVNLNGTWRYAFTDSEKKPAEWQGNITVPFAPEALASGVGHVLQPGGFLWYTRSFRLQPGFNAGRVLLHFGAVDETCVVYLNGAEIGCHENGYLPFTLDITDHLADHNNTLAVRVADATDKGPAMRGRQKLACGGCWHTPMSGIWQTVWLESVPKHYIEEVKITPLYDEGAVRVQVRTTGGKAAGRMAVLANKSLSGAADYAEADGPVTIRLPGKLSWTPGNPFLYTLVVRAGEDIVECYFGMRKLSVETDERGYARIFLNNKPLLLSGVLDQGIYPATGYTPPDDRAMAEDIRFAKECGFNMIRKMGKLEPMRWYYLCDKMGMLVWQDIPAGRDAGGGEAPGPPALPFGHRDTAHARFGRKDEAARAAFERDVWEMAALLHNAPCLVAWVLFNEGVGQFDAARLALELRRREPERLVDHASGWADQKGGDFVSWHFPAGKPPRKLPETFGGRIFAVTQAGGIGLDADGASKTPVCDGPKVADSGRLFAEMAALWEKQAAPLVYKGLSVFVYSQLTDAEDEVSGLLCRERKPKVDRRDVARMNAALAETFNRALRARQALQAAQNGQK